MFERATRLHRWKRASASGRIFETGRAPIACRTRKVFATSPLAAPLLSLDVRNFGTSEVVKGYEVCKENAPFHTVLFTVDGSGHFESDDGGGRLVAGDMFFVTALSRVRYWAARTWEMCWFHLHASSRWQFFQGSGVQVSKSRHCREMRAVVDALIAEEPLGRDPLTHRTARRLGETVAVYLERELAPKLPPKKHEERQVLDELQQKVRERPYEEWTVEKLAGDSHMSKRSLLRVFLNVTGEAPGEMVRRVRMDAAAAYITETDWTLDKIAHHTGYSTGFALSRAFKKKFGYSPQRLRTDLR